MAASTSNPNKWAVFGFTTTPEERIGPDPPYTYQALQVNLFFRVFLGVVSLFITWIPGRLLYRNGEFGGMMLCALTMTLNFFTIINALIWRNDDVESWYAGYGWCDLQAYILFALHTSFNIALFEVMRGLAAKCAIDRVTSLTSGEKQRQQITSAVVIFAIPIIQVILTYPLAVGRFNVSTLVGCSVYYMPNWLFLIFFVIPTPIFITGAAIMAGLTFYRYRKIERATRKIISSQDSVAGARQARVRKKLYFTTLGCIVVVLPLTLTLFVRNVLAGSPWTRPFDFDSFHYGPDPFNSGFISFTTSDMMSFQQLAISYIPEIAGIALFIPFGTTIDALNAYRKALLALGLGILFPKLREEIKTKPKDKGSSPSWWSSLIRPLRSTTSSVIQSRKASLLPTVEHASVSSRNSAALSPSSSSRNQNPWPDLSAREIDSYSSRLRSPAASPARPLPVMHAAALGPNQPVSVQFPSVPVAIPSFRRGSEPASPRTSVAGEKPWEDLNQQNVGVDTRVWSDAEKDAEGGGEAGVRRNVVRVETRINTTSDGTEAGQEDQGDRGGRATS
ncbi:pheromone A receptor-domain-containing protein [Cladorrhinum samala]|uniref:Pheromone A receptor-domain-containing protein n=1 Tax=Cladorrhinum samala TaxID=585594 RepID=A0AAV9HDU5_9PEZI|nr:pheromone A receptor-domain-containing protein [Cladorrhinum samala]